MTNNFWGKSQKIIDIEKAKTSFIKDFKAVKEMGYIRSHRPHDTGIGKTFEDIMKVEENNLKIADYQGCIEIKSQRDDTGSMITLFTKSPSYPENVNQILRDRYGKLDPDSGYKILHTTMKHSAYNTFAEKWGFKLDINKLERRIEIKIKNLKTNQIEDFLVYYSFDDIKQAIISKLGLIAYITADRRIVDGHEEFHYTKATLLSNLKFLENVRNDNIKYDIRIGTNKSGDKIGQLHDHGSGFRFKRENIPQLFDIEEIS